VRLRIARLAPHHHSRRVENFSAHRAWLTIARNSRIFSATVVVTFVQVTVASYGPAGFVGWTVTGDEPIPTVKTGDGLSVTGERVAWGGRTDREALAAELMPLLLAEV